MDLTETASEQHLLDNFSRQAVVKSIFDKSQLYSKVVFLSS